ncbi:MAG: M20/M25/M40 family metallo-hydrolase [Acidobacteriota bacterium]
MRKKIFFAIACWLWLSPVSFGQDPQPSAPQPPRVSTPEEISAEFDSVPCKNKDRIAAVKALFEKMGAKPDEITVEKFGSVENVVVKIAGTSTEAAAEKIVVGAHFDKVADGCGAIDNWTGIVAITHIYRTMKTLKPNRTLIFVGFGEEEKGLVGSRAMVDKIKKEQVAEYCAMINIDSLGVAMPQAADNMSSKKLLDVTAEIAKEMGMPFAHAGIPNAGADSMTFVAKKIPAITIHGLTNDWPKILHSSNDKPEKVNRQSVYLGYRLALALLAKVDDSPCQAFREGREAKDDKGGKEKK